MPDPRLTPHAELLDAAATSLLDQPRASLAQVAKAAGIGRTTLFKAFATREDLEHAVAMRAVDVCRQAIATVDVETPDGGLRALIEALVPIGPQLSFIWRTPALDLDPEVVAELKGMDRALVGVLRGVQERGVLASDRPDWWLAQTLYALVYVGWECVESGALARLDAPGLVLSTLLEGVGSTQAVAR